MHLKYPHRSPRLWPTSGTDINRACYARSNVSVKCALENQPFLHGSSDFSQVLEVHRVSTPQAYSGCKMPLITESF